MHYSIMLYGKNKKCQLTSIFLLCYHGYLVVTPTLGGVAISSVVLARQNLQPFTLSEAEYEYASVADEDGRCAGQIAALVFIPLHRS